MLKMLRCDEGCETDSRAYYFDAEIDAIRVGDVLSVEIFLSKRLAKTLSGQCVLRDEGEYVSGYTYVTYDKDELELIKYIQGYLEGHINCLELK